MLEHIFDADVRLASQTRNIVGDWRISTSAPSTPSSSQQQASSASQRAGPGTTQRAAAPKPSRYATPGIESSSEEENEGSAYEPSETEETAATTPDFEMASVDEDSKEDVRQVDEVYFVIPHALLSLSMLSPTSC